MLMGCHKGRMDPVTQPHKMETLGDICQRKGTGGTGPGNDMGKPQAWSKIMAAWHQNAGGLPVAPTFMAGGLAADQCNTTGDGGLGMTMEGGPNHLSWGWGCGPQVLAAIWATSPVSPGAGKAHSSRHWCRRKPPSTITTDAIITTAATTWKYRVSVLVGRADASPRPYKLSGVCLEGACLFWGTINLQLGKEGGELLHATPSASLYQQILLLTAEGCAVHLPGHPPWSGTACHCLHNGFAVLGWVGAFPSPSSSGREHAGDLVGNGTTCFLWGGRDLCNHGANQLDRSYLAMVTLPWSIETMLQPPQEPWKHYTHNVRACLRGPMINTWS